MRQWRLTEGPEKEVFFTQDHAPGEVLAVDWTDMASLGITIQGKALAHKLFHAVLPYSNWEWAVRASSESTLSLRAGLKAALGRLGRVPRELLTDHSSTATHQLSRGGSGGFSTRNICRSARTTASRRARSMWAGRRKTATAKAATGI